MAKFHLDRKYHYYSLKSYFEPGAFARFELTFKSDNKSAETKIIFKDQMLGSLQPLAGMAKDFLNTFKPYRVAYRIREDFAQFFYGMANSLFVAPLMLVFTPLLFLINFIRIAFSSGSWANFKNNLRVHCALSLSWLTNGLLTLVKGLTQVAFCVFVLPKILLRLALTRFQGVPKIEQRESVQNLVSEGVALCQHGNAAQLRAMVTKLNGKFFHHASKKERSDVKRELESKLYLTVVGRDPQVKANALRYLGLFSLDAEVKRQAEAGPAPTSPLLRI